MSDICHLCLPDPRMLAAMDDAFWLLREGEALVLAPRRHVARWADLAPEERAALGEAIAEAQARLGGAPSVRFDETGDHFRILIGAEAQAAAPTLITGPEDALLHHLRPHIDAATSVDAAIAFAMRSGVELLHPHLEELLERGGRLRLLVGDYMGASDPEALRRLLDLPAGPELMGFSSGPAFHPKSWLIAEEGGGGVLIVGSSNLSASALESGVEWNLRLLQSPAEAEAARAAFDALFARPEVQPLTHEWIDAYAARRRPAPQISGAPEEPEAPPPEPHAVQSQALEALDRSRALGHRAGLVVLATGLGKTFLAAFDSRPFARVLFVAHRAEILSQAMRAFRAVRPGAKLGRWDGEEKSEGDVLFASIQTLGRARHLQGFAEDAFDYIVIDEFHHAAAATYRRVIEHFRPKFLLGLTATPERADGGDLLSLCAENLVFRCDMFEGIGKGLLAPFTYHGLPDDVDYAQIPWRGRRFDEAALTEAVATQARADAALDELTAKGGERAIGFCVSQRHAEFMKRAAEARGLKARAVHAGAGSDSRAAALEALEAGGIDILFAVDMFNEGLDVPAIDTVLMLRPTESPVIWLQQFGRGLRRAEGKARLTVIDYIGAHRSFLVKARALLGAGETDRALEAKLREVRTGMLDLPPGCEILYETETLDIMERLLRRTAAGDMDQFEAWYADFRLRHGQRPNAGEAAKAGFDPRKTGHGGWFDFVAAQGDLEGAEAGAHAGFNDFLKTVETTALTKSYKILVLLGMIAAGAFPGEIPLHRLGAEISRLAQAPKLRADLSVDPDDGAAVARLLRKYPLTAWADADQGRWFALSDLAFRTTFTPPPETGAALAVLVRELAEWRLAEHLGRSDRVFATAETERTEAAEGAAVFERAPTLWQEYMREDIPPLFGQVFSPGNWNGGIVALNAQKRMILLATLDKKGLSAGEGYHDAFETPELFHWTSQNSTKRSGKRGQVLCGQTPGWTVELFVRPEKLRAGKACPFHRVGPVRFLEWEGDAPISVKWKLETPVPPHLRKLYRID